MSEEKERDRGTEGEIPAPIHRGWRSEKKTEERKTERNSQRVPNPATLEHSVASYDAQGSYGEPIRFTHPVYRWGLGVIIYLFIYYIESVQIREQYPRKGV